MAGVESGPEIEDDRPPRSLWSVGRALRAVAGVEQLVFRDCVGEKARYASLGGVVLGTSAIAAFSMGMALSEVMDGFTLALLLPAIGWGLFVLNLDRWIVATTSSGLLQSRVLGSVSKLGSYGARLAIAIFLGFVIAEPLVLRVFESAIEATILTERSEQLRELESNLNRCNPGIVDGQPPTSVPPGCAEFSIVVEADSSSSGELIAVEALRVQLTELNAQIAGSEARLQDLTDLVVRECSGVDGDDTTGVPGDGPVCQQNRGLLESARQDLDLAGAQARRAGLERQINGAIGRTSTAAASYDATRSAELLRRVAEFRLVLDDPDTPEPFDAHIGLLERFDTLHDLAEDDDTLGNAIWAIRLIFVLVDSAPVVIKLFSPDSTYERVVKQRLTAVREISRVENDARIERARQRARVSTERIRVYSDSQVDEAKLWHEQQRAINRRKRDEIVADEAERIMRAHATKAKLHADDSDLATSQ